MNLPAATVIGIALMAAAIWLGTIVPVTLSFEAWLVILFFYIIIAAAIPVNILLQPRDYLNSWLLYFGDLRGFRPPLSSPSRESRFGLLGFLARPDRRETDAVLACHPPDHRLRLPLGLPFPGGLGNVVQADHEGK
jgi:hypothetical protein